MTHCAMIELSLAHLSRYKHVRLPLPGSQQATGAISITDLFFFGDTGDFFLQSGDGFLVQDHMGCQASLGSIEMFMSLLFTFLMGYLG